MSKREEEGKALVDSAKDAMESAARRIEEKVSGTINFYVDGCYLSMCLDNKQCDVF